MSEVKTSPSSKARLAQRIPKGMRSRHRWMGTRFKRKADGKADKPPYRVRGGHPIQPGSKTNPEDWTSFTEARAALLAGQVDAIGYVLTADDPFVVVDLDGVVDPATGEIEPAAQSIVDGLNTYTEVSCSGTGIHAVLIGEKHTFRCRRGGLEIYDRARFMVMTGTHVAGTPTNAEARQDELDALIADHMEPSKRATNDADPTRLKPTGVSTLKDAELLDKARNATGGNGERFRRLYDAGDWSGYPSQSEADYALCRTLAFYTNHDAEAIDRLFRASALYRRKWERGSYREPTIDSAIRTQLRAYTGRPARDDTGVRERIAQLRTESQKLAFTGRRGPSKWASYMAALDYAEEFGRVHGGGVSVELPERTAALGAGISQRAVRNALIELCEESAVMKLLRKGKGTRAACFLLKLDGSKVRNEEQCVAHCVPLSGEIRQIRNAAPLTEKEFDKNGRKLSKGTAHLLQRLGKLCALILERIGAAPEGITLDALARGLDRKRSNVRRSLSKLVDAGLVFEDGGVLKVPPDFEGRLQTELAESGCLDARQRDADRYAKDRAEFKKYRAGENSADEAPSAEDMEAERLGRTQRAFNVLSDPTSGPGMMLRTYLRGESKTFAYVVAAVATYCKSGDSEVWRKPVADAYALLTDGVPVHTEDAES